LSNISLTVKGSQYVLELKEGDAFIWKVMKFNSEEAIVFSIDPNIKIGMAKKISVESIEEKSEFWKINVEFWTYTESIKNVSAAKETSFIIDKTPEDDDIGGWIIPTPVEDYLSDIQEDISNESPNVELVKKSVSVEIFIEFDDLIFSYIYEIRTGLLLSLTYSKNDEIVFKIQLERLISGYSSFLLILSVSLIGIVILYKNRIFKRSQLKFNK